MYNIHYSITWSCFSPRYTPLLYLSHSLLNPDSHALFTILTVFWCTSFLIENRFFHTIYPEGFFSLISSQVLPTSPGSQLHTFTLSLENKQVNKQRGKQRKRRRYTHTFRDTHRKPITTQNWKQYISKRQVRLKKCPNRS